MSTTVFFNPLTYHQWDQVVIPSLSPPSSPEASSTSIDHGVTPDSVTAFFKHFSAPTFGINTEEEAVDAIRQASSSHIKEDPSNRFIAEEECTIIMMRLKLIWEDGREDRKEINDQITCISRMNRVANWIVTNEFEFTFDEDLMANFFLSSNDLH